MAQTIGKMVAKRFFKETTANKFGSEDPYFETVPASRMGVFKKKSKKALPPGLTEKEKRILNKAKRRAYRMDLMFNSCGLQFGLGAIIGIIPGIGDVLDLLMAMMVFRTCCSVEPPLPSSLRTRMQLNLLIDFAIGLVPFVGDIADAVYKCNTRNVVLLEKELRKRGAARLTPAEQQDTVDPSLADVYDGYDEEAPPPRYTSRKQNRSGRQPDLETGLHAPPAQPPRR